VQNRPTATNYERAFEQRPEVYAAWQQLNRSERAGRGAGTSLYRRDVLMT
jgi:hypothetical protein